MHKNREDRRIIKRQRADQRSRGVALPVVPHEPAGGSYGDQRCSGTASRSQSGQQVDDLVLTVDVRRQSAWRSAEDGLVWELGARRELPKVTGERS